jgi:acid phosphatase type 7
VYRSLAAIAVLILSCSDSGGGSPDAALEEDPMNGGSLVMAGCGTTLTTPIKASVPVLIPAGSEPLLADATPRHIHLGLVSDPKTSIAVVWRTMDDLTKATTMRYRREGDTEWTYLDGASFEYITGFGWTGDRVRVHEVHLCGLTADTAYDYQVGGGGAGDTASWSTESRFRTAPDLSVDASAEVTVLVLGDTRGGDAIWGGLLRSAFELSPPDLILFSGDAVTLGNIQLEWDAFLDQGGEMLRSAPVVFAHGNHENNAPAFYSLNAMPGNEQWFSLDYGALHLVVLNDEPEDVASVAGAQKTFLDEDLTAQTNSWSALMHHRSMWSAGTAHGSNLEIRAAWGATVDEHDVDLVFSGHDHNYERTKPLRNEVETAGGTIYVVAGNAGAPLTTSGTGFWTAFSEATPNFMILRVRPGTLEASAFRDDTSALDSFTLQK